MARRVTFVSHDSVVLDVSDEHVTVDGVEVTLPLGEPAVGQPWFYLAHVEGAAPAAHPTPFVESIEDEPEPHRPARRVRQAEAPVAEEEASHAPSAS